MGSRAEANYKGLVKRLLKWPGVRERPEDPNTEFGASCVRPSLRMNGARFATFHLGDARRLHVAFRLPPSRGGEEARVDLQEKDALGRALALAAELYELRTGRPPPAA